MVSLLREKLNQWARLTAPDGLGEYLVLVALEGEGQFAAGTVTLQSMVKISCVCAIAVHSALLAPIRQASRSPLWLNADAAKFYRCGFCTS